MPAGLVKELGPSSCLAVEEIAGPISGTGEVVIAPATDTAKGRLARRRGTHIALAAVHGHGAVTPGLG